MSEARCPQCDSSNVLLQSRLAKGGDESKATVGRWRVGCGATLAMIVLILGAIAGYMALTLEDPTFRQYSLIFAVICLVFAANGLGSTFYFSRWKPTDRYLCQDCDNEWFPPRQAEDQADQLA